jgi:hypothetical protein
MVFGVGLRPPKISNAREYDTNIIKKEGNAVL